MVVSEIPVETSGGSRPMSQILRQKSKQDGGGSSKADLEFDEHPTPGAANTMGDVARATARHRRVPHESGKIVREGPAAYAGPCSIEHGGLPGDHSPDSASRIHAATCALTFGGRSPVVSIMRASQGGCWARSSRIQRSQRISSQASCRRTSGRCR